MAKARRQPRRSAPIPENLPPVFAPQNGRLTHQTLRRAKEQEESEKRNQEHARIYQIKQDLFRTLVDREREIVPPHARAVTADGHSALIDLPMNPYDFVAVQALADGQPDQINVTGGTEPIGLYSRGNNTVLVPEAPTTPNYQGTHTVGVAVDLGPGGIMDPPARERLQQSINVLNTQMTAEANPYNLALFPAQTASVTGTITLGSSTSNTIVIPGRTMIPTNGTIYTGYTAATNYGQGTGGTANWLLTVAGEAMTNQQHVWTGHDDDWGCYSSHVNKPRCKDDWGPAWSRRHKRNEHLIQAVAYIEQLTDQQSAWKQWSTILHTSKESRAQQEARQLEARRIEAARQERLRVEQLMYSERQGRAEKLLKAVLNPAQREQYERDQYFHVRGQSGRNYRIRAGNQHGNVFLLDEKNQEMISYCIQPVGGLPNADAHVAQKLMLETDEAAFLRIANATTLRRAA